MKGSEHPKTRVTKIEIIWRKPRHFTAFECCTHQPDWKRFSFASLWADSKGRDSGWVLLHPLFFFKSQERLRATGASVIYDNECPRRAKMSISANISPGPSEESHLLAAGTELVPYWGSLPGVASGLLHHGRTQERTSKRKVALLQSGGCSWGREEAALYCF